MLVLHSVSFYCFRSLLAYFEIYFVFHIYHQSTDKTKSSQESTMKYKLLTSVSNDRNATRSFCDFRTKEELANRLIGYFEDYLMTIRQSNPQPRGGEELEYISDDLFAFLDTFFGELVCLVRDNDEPSLWIPYPSDWVKEVVYMYLKSLSDTESVQNGSFK